MIRNNWDHINTVTSGDYVFTNLPAQQNLPEVMFGIYYKHEKLFVGLSAPELLNAGKGDGPLYKPAMLSAGYLVTISDEVKIKPSVLFKYIKNSPVEVDLNTNVYFKAFGVGISYRTSDAMVFMASYNINHQLSAGYAYDLTISKLGTYVRSSHEIMLKYEFGYSVHPQSPRYF
jgi:type IX secretion system PorP/SprF family membrane protein